jgi:hypothetical protein
MSDEGFDDNTGRADDFHGDDGTGFIENLINGRDGARKDQRESDGTDYSNFIDNKPVYTYPQDLFQANQVNGVCFFVKVRNNSVAGQLQGSAGPDGLAADRIGAFKTSHSEMATQMNRSSVENYENLTLAAGALITTAGAAKVFGTSKTNKNKGKSLMSKAGSILSKGLQITAGVGGAVALNQIHNMNQEKEEGIPLSGGDGGTQFLNKVIQLHVPQSIISQYQADWNDTELGMAGMLANARSADQASARDVGESAVRGLITGAANLPRALGVDAALGDAIAASSRKTANPYKEQLFKSIGFRSFAFSYTFNPKNLAEYNDVRAIINTFKYHMHPEISPGQAFLIYPSEFNIEFYHASNGEVRANRHLPKISDCALKDVKVTYGPDGFFNTVAGTGGIPSEISMQLTFTELETMTANRIADGY